MLYFYAQGYGEGFGPEITGSGEHAVTHYRYLLSIWLTLLLCWEHFKNRLSFSDFYWFLSVISSTGYNINLEFSD
jgi:hypothetical protein